MHMEHSQGPQIPHSAPSTDVGGFHRGHVTHVGADMFPSSNVAGSRQVDDGDWVGMHTSAENPTAQDQQRDLQHRDRFVPDNVPVEAHVAPAPVIDAFNDDVQQAAADDHALAFLDEVPHQGPVPNRRASDALRQLALLYLNDPNSEIVMIRMGPGHDDDVTVDFTLRLTNL